MTTSSVPTDYSTILSGDTITITGYDPSNFSTMPTLTTAQIVSLGTSNSGMYYTAPSMATMSTINSGSINTISVDTSTWNTSFKLPTDWVDSFPSCDKVQDMCKQYPSLEIALRNFQTIYQLVKDDYDNPAPKK
jgi:hypothetical protein